jgi:hypothetical protein
MDFQCPNCNVRYKNKVAKPGQKAKCKVCKSIFRIPLSIELPAESPILSPPATEQFKKAKQTAMVAVRRIWTNAPGPFRNAFLATCGVLSSLMVTWFIYGNVHGTSKPADTLETLTAQMAQCGLFPDGTSPHPGIFRGRNLQEYRFLPDANFDSDYLSIWLNDDHQLVGVSTIWFADARGIPKEENDKEMSYFFRITKIQTVFERLTNFDVINISHAKFVPDNENRVIAQIESRHWKIKASKSIMANEKRLIFCVTAQNW